MMSTEEVGHPLMDVPAPPRSARDPIVDAYRAQTRTLTARRVPMAAVLFLVVIAVASGFEWLYHPERAAALALAYAAYLVASAGQVMVVYRRPALAIIATQAAVNALALGLSVYFGTVHSGTEALLLGLALLMTGVAVLYPWGLRGQLGASIGALLGYPLALLLGANSTLPIPYEVFALLTAASVAALGASVLDQHGFSIFRHEAFTLALLDVGRTLDATISDPQALAAQLTEQARRVLGADWAVLYQKDFDGAVFRATAFNGAPDADAEEIRGLNFSPATAPEFFRVLQQSGTVELLRSGSDVVGVASLLHRWHVSAALLQAIKREQEVIGILGCCYGARGAPFAERERRVLAAIATQASIALENARLMEDTRRANRLKSEFVATVSHELRTPLTAIVGYTEILLEDAGDVPDAERLDMLQRVRDQSLQLNDLIQAMLDLNRIESRRLPLAISAFTIGDLITGLRNNLPATWRKEGVTLQWTMQDEQAVLQSDRGKVEMIVRNLIHNALKYTDVGSVTVAGEADSKGRRVVFSVTDTGPGIAPEDQSAIFEMFRQGHNPSRGGGVGLGLHIVQRFTEALGGQVRVESREGTGARFVVTLPMEAPDVTTA